jgi:hypothetical protein
MKILHFFPLFVRRPGNAKAFAALAELRLAYNARSVVPGLPCLRSPVSFRAHRACLDACGAIRHPPAFIVLPTPWHLALLSPPPPIRQPA